MLSSRRIAKVLAVVVVTLTTLIPAGAHAAAPASVTVRVEGANQTLLAPTTVTTNATPIEKDGNPEHTCSGGSAAGALDQATSGDWSGTWFSGIGYSVETILGETHAFEPGVPANYFWAYWLDDKPSSAGICEGELSSGESILFFPECFSETGACPSAPNPLGISAPATVERGSTVAVSVTSYANITGEPSPAVGATVTGGGASATTDAGGQATLTLSQTGNFLLQATAAGSVRSETSVCVHAGNDGNCGTSKSSSASPSAPASQPSYTGPYAIVAAAGGVLEGHVYKAGAAPRLLTGTITAHTTIVSVSISLRRSYRGRCYAYDGASTRFVHARCGTGSFFKVGSTSNFSYLLPGSLAPGRYVLDIEGTDAAGNTTTLARGSSRVVFYVAPADVAPAARRRHRGR